MTCGYTRNAYTNAVKLVFIEAPLFTRLLPDYLDDEAYTALQNMLLANPDLGDVMPGTGGFRKVRWYDKMRGKGKRGGVRIIYYYLITDRQIWFYTIYGKGEVAGLTNEENSALKNAIRGELKARRQNDE